MTFFSVIKNQIQSSHKIKISNQGYKGIVHLLKTIQVSLTHKQHTWISKLQSINFEPRGGPLDLLTLHTQSCEVEVYFVF